MSMVAEVVAAMENILGPESELLAAKHFVIKRKRKFTGQTLLRMIVLTLLKNPNANWEDLTLTASLLGIQVSATAVEKRFTQSLADFLRDVVSLAIQQLVTAEPVSVELFQRFTAVFIGDSFGMPGVLFTGTFPSDRRGEGRFHLAVATRHNRAE